MSRAHRLELAKQTVEIAERGHYVAEDGRNVDIGPAVHACIQGTRLYAPDTLEVLRQTVLASPAPGTRTVIEVVNETTLAGIARLSAENAGPVAALNFASARNPGGGFLNGSQAQEESLARSSALYLSQLQAGEFYRQHRAAPSLLYSDAMILSPECPVFRDDDGRLLAEPQLVTFITSAAPNAGAIASNAPEELSAIPEVFRRRSALVLALAASCGYRRLVLGAWGCGVFRNDPALVAAVYANHLHGAWAGRFERIVFSVLDTSSKQATFDAFRSSSLSDL